MLYNSSSPFPLPIYLVRSTSSHICQTPPFHERPGSVSPSLNGGVIPSLPRLFKTLAPPNPDHNSVLVSRAPTTKLLRIEASREHSLAEIAHCAQSITCRGCSTANNAASMLCIAGRDEWPRSPPCQSTSASGCLAIVPALEIFHFTRSGREQVVPYKMSSPDSATETSSQAQPAALTKPLSAIVKEVPAQDEVLEAVSSLMPFHSSCY